MGMNLIYNGDFHNGAFSWHSSSGDSYISASNGVLTSNSGDLSQDTAYLVPVANGRRYRLTFDLKFIQSDGSHPWYIALRTYDNNKQHIAIANVLRYYPTAQTTLASALSNGATTVSLTSATGWTQHTYQRIGICDKLAWGYNRATYSQSYQSLSGTTITLKSAWAGGSFAAGTKVAEFHDGSTYFYPFILNVAQHQTTWTSYSCEFDGGDAMRYSCQYFQFGTLGYSHKYQLRNIHVECINDYQEPHWEQTSSANADVRQSTHITKTGQTQLYNANEIYARARYVRDHISNSTANNYNHYCEFQIFNTTGENIALGKDVITGQGDVTSVTRSNSVITDGIVDSQYTTAPSGTDGWAKIDLGYVEDISKIKIWHYWPDGRTYYNNFVDISTDNTNWTVVYQGEKPETAAGNEIILGNDKVSFYYNAEVKANQFYEY